MRIPKTIEQAAQKAEQLFPFLKHARLTVPEQGGQNFTLIYGDQVVRLPRNEPCLQELAKEAATLQRLAGRDLGVKIPKVIEHDRNNHVLIMNRMEGRPLSPFNLHAMRQTDLEHIGIQLGTFLHQMHTAHPANQTKKEYADSLRAYHAGILMRGRSQATADAAGISLNRLRLVESGYLRSFAEIEDKISFLHGDLTFGNILYDSSTKKIAVIDFMSSREGYIHEDFLHLGAFPQVIQEECLSIYGLLSGREIDRPLLNLSRDARNMCRIVEGQSPLITEPLFQKDFC